jgi:SLOG family YspA-like protein
MPPPFAGRRLLVTGSRDWCDTRTLGTALRDVLDAWGGPLDTVLVEGECPYGGADIIARTLWEWWNLPVEKHPADRDRKGRILGPQRNQRMVDAGADLCLAFPMPHSRGTTDCITRAERAGIPVRVITPRGGFRP